MTFAQTGGPDYDARIRRAKHLGAIHAFATEVMTFYGHLAAFQKRLYAQLPKSSDQRPRHSATTADFRSHLDLALLLPHFPDLLALLQSVGPPPVADAARQLSLQGPAAWIAFLTDYWSPERKRRTLSARKISSPPPKPSPNSSCASSCNPTPSSSPQAASLLNSKPHTSVCPICNSAPLLGVLRPEGDGGRRCLLCSFCLQEWNFRRILCPTCGEEAENKLPVYVAEQFPHIRVEACDTCRSYLRTIDLTKDGHAIPLVDDLAAIPLTLWATEHGYSRPHPNLLGT